MVQSCSASSDYSSSDSEGGEPLQKRQRLKLPASVAGLFVNPSHEDSALHQGRSRRVAHVDGNFATLAYLKIEQTEIWHHCAEMCATLLRQLAHHSAGVVDVHLAGGQIGGADIPQAVSVQQGASLQSKTVGLHVSLGPLIMLRQQFIEPFKDKLRKVAAGIGTNGGQVVFDEQIHVFGSEDGKRYFAGMVVAESSSSLLRSVAQGVMESSRALGLAQNSLQVESMLFHCSLAWTCADLEPGLAAAGAERCESDWGVSWRLTKPISGCNLTFSEAVLRASARSFQVKIGERVSCFPMHAAGFAEGDDEAESD